MHGCRVHSASGHVHDRAGPGPMGLSVARCACERRAWTGTRIAWRTVCWGMTRHMATLEVTLMGPHIRFEADAAFAVTGAEFRLTLDDVPVEMNRAVEAKAGFNAEIRRAPARRARVRRRRRRRRCPEVLGSRSTHVLTGMGGHEGRALKAGDALSIGVRGKGQGVMSRASRPLPFAPFSARSCAAVPCGRAAVRAPCRRSGSGCRPSPIAWAIASRGHRSPMRRAGELISTAVPTGRDSGAADGAADPAHERSRDDRRICDCRHGDYGRPSARRSACAGRLD